MITVRCTRDLLKLLSVKAQETTIKPEAALGDWYAKPVATAAGDFIVCISEVTYLSILVPEVLHRDIYSFFPMRFAQLLADLGIPDVLIQAECAHYQDIVFGRSQSRRTLGILNEIAYYFQSYAEYYSLVEASDMSAAQLDLANAIFGSPHYTQPGKATIELLGG